MTWSDEYKMKMREFMQAHGNPVEFEPKRYDWQSDDDRVSTYGWTDYEVLQHVREGTCRLIVPEGAVLTERTYSQFTDTNHSNEMEVGVNVSGCHCACGAYDNLTVRYVGTVQEVMRHILNIPNFEAGVAL